MSLPSSFLLLVGAVFIHIVLAQESVVTKCSRDPTGVFAHPDNCHQYFTCSADSNRLNTAQGVAPDSQDSYLNECPYPQLFNELTWRCDDYRHVQCGQKFVPLDKCEYSRYQSRGRQSSVGTPCNVLAPSCKGLADGVRVYRGREWSPYFAICQDQRLVNTSTCDRVLDTFQLFSPDLGRCVSLYEIPVGRGGCSLTCTGRSDGLYLDDVCGNPNIFFRCSSETVKEIYLCPSKQQSVTKLLSCSTLVSVK